MNGINVKVTLYRFIALITREKDRLEIKDKDENRKVFSKHAHTSRLAHMA